MPHLMGKAVAALAATLGMREVMPEWLVLPDF